jgi:hypothetical protein
MIVASFFVGYDRQRPINPEINQSTLCLIFDCIIQCTEARVEMNDEDHRFEPAGSPLEVALLNLMVDNGIPI